MKHSYNILVTGVGAPGIKGTLYSLRNNPISIDTNIFGTDIRENVVGKYLCDDFTTIDRPSSPSYLDQLQDICTQNNIDVILPQNTAELQVLATNRNRFQDLGVHIIVSSEETIDFVNNKYNLMKLAADNGVPTAAFHLVDNMDDLLKYASDLEWPDMPVVVKPPASNGSRGVRIIDEKMDLKKKFFNDKPTSLYTTMEYLKSVLGETFPDLMVMDYLPGNEYTVDGLRLPEQQVIIPRKRSRIRSGITFEGKIEKNEDIISYSEILANNSELEFIYGFQFKLDENGTPKIIESNPRVQGTMVMSTLSGANLIFGAIHYLLSGNYLEYKIDWDLQFQRFWGGLGIGKDIIEI